MLPPQNAQKPHRNGKATQEQARNPLFENVVYGVLPQTRKNLGAATLPLNPAPTLQQRWHNAFDPLENLLFHVQPRRFWAFDSEFISSGRPNHPEDVHTIQFSDGTDTFVLESAEQLKQWLTNHHRIKTLYGFVILCDLASISEWLGQTRVIAHKRGSQTVGSIHFRGFKATVYDAQPLLKSFGVNRLEDAGEIIGYPKLPKPDYIGKRKYQSAHERRQFIAYAEADAVITSRIVKWLFNNFNADPQRHASAGTLARDIFDLPERLERYGRNVYVPPLENRVHSAIYAGRNEGFKTGNMQNAVYNDVSSLYPVSMCATHCLEITGAKACSPSELTIDKNCFEGKNYGWLEGSFESTNDKWALPLRGKNVFYATGTIQGFYHTYDLAAAHAKIVHVTRAYKPIFEVSPIHEKFVKMTLDRVEGRLEGNNKKFAKAVLNACSGKLGQAKPPATTSNFFAYSTLLAHSHALMSHLFGSCTTEILAMDTDSIFSYDDMSGKWFELDEGEYSIPVKMDVKGRGDLSFFRAKNYILQPQEGKPVFGRHGWVYWLEDFLKLHDGGLTELLTRQDIKATLLTRVKEAQRLAKGRWRTKPVTLSLEKLKSLLKADTKRQRNDYDSYGLVTAKRSEPSRAWNYDEMLLEQKELFRFS